MSIHPAILELQSIVQEESLESRKKSLKEWQSKWLTYTEKTQYVVNKSVMNSEDTDFTWYKLAELCAESLIDENISINTTTNNSFSCGIYALRSPNGELEEGKESTKKTKRARRSS